MPKQIKCKRCKYEWITNSDKEYICCPSCLRKNKNIQIIIKLKEEAIQNEHTENN